MDIISSNAAFTMGADREGLVASNRMRLFERVRSRGVETPISTAVLSIKAMSTAKICCYCANGAYRVMSAMGVLIL